MNKSTDKERADMALRIKEALSACPSKVFVANKCGVSEQAITGWVRTGRISKKNLPVLAEISRYRVDWLLTGVGAKIEHHLAEDQNEVATLMTEMEPSDRATVVSIARRLARAKNYQHQDVTQPPAEIRAAG